MSFISEFKQFAMRGNVVDMAVGIIIGGAFGKIVSSVVNDIVMPPIGVLIGGVDFNDLSFTLKSAVSGAGGEVVTPAVTLNYGNFLQTTFDFIIIAFAIFMMIKAMNKMKKSEETAPVAPVAPPAPPEPTNEEKLLSEIRDLLKNK